MVISGRTVDLMLNAAFGGQMSVARFEGLCCGDPLVPVTGAVVCYAPTVRILRRAVAEGRNLIIAREHPLYLHGGLNHAYLSEGLLKNDPVVDLRPAGSDRDLFITEGLNGDPVVKAKLQIIVDGELVIYRQGSSWDQFRPAAQSAALARSLGMEVPPHQEAGRRRGVICDLPPGTQISDIADKARSAVGSAGPRVIGDSSMTVSRACIIAGESDPVETLADLLSDSTVDLVITGAGGILDEVDGGISYFLDVMGTGRRIAMLTVGYGPSHEPGVHEMRDMMQRVLPDLSLEYWQSGDPSWTPDDRQKEAQR